MQCFNRQELELMITIKIPGYQNIEAQHLVLDFNGTLAIDGKLIDEIKPLIEVLSNQLTIHVLTADTFGTCKNELSALKCSLQILSPNFQDSQKESYILSFGEKQVIAIGNGSNDALMVKSAALGIVVLQKEGASVKTILSADIVCNNILDALELLINPLRIVSTLRI